MQTKRHKEWRGHSYALYLRGGPENWNPCSHIRMLPRQSVVHSYICKQEWHISAFPFAF